MKNKTKVALLLRVSSKEQKHDRQLSELTEYAASKGFEVVEVITETISGAKKNSERKGIQRLLQLAADKAIAKVLVLEVSRLGRDTAQVLTTLEALHALNVSIVVKNYQLDTLNVDGTPNAMAQFLLTILADIARMERATLVERVTSGLAEAKKKGVVLGRKKGDVKSKADMLKDHKAVVKHLKAGRSIRETAKLAGVGVSTVQRVKRLI